MLSLPLNDFSISPDVFSNVASTSASFGVVPIENSSIGIVHETMQALRTTELSVRGMIGLKVGHALLSRPFSKDDDGDSQKLYGDEEQRKRYKRVYSHEQVRKAFLLIHVPWSNLSGCSHCSILAFGINLGHRSMRSLSSEQLSVGTNHSSQLHSLGGTKGTPGPSARIARDLFDQVRRGVWAKGGRQGYSGWWKW